MRLKAVALVLIVVVAAAAASLTAAWVWLEDYLDTPLTLAAPARLDVAPGRSLAGIADELGARGALAHPRVLALYGRYTGQATAIQAGEYEIAQGTTPRTLLDQLVAGRVTQYSVTLVEGWTFRQALAAIQSHPAVTVTLDPQLDPQALASELGLDGHPEGQFFPDTYVFRRGVSDARLLGRARTAMQERLAAAWEARADGLPIDTPYEALILASIIEKETALSDEQPQIAGVFARRLQRGMRLQTDPTVIYGLGDAFDGNLRRRDLETDTPYNTYTRHGLPPTPIALPGAGALAAAVTPKDGDALYFVATGKGDGSHHFSATLEEHNRAVRRYLARLRESRNR